MNPTAYITSEYNIRWTPKPNITFQLAIDIRDLRNVISIPTLETKDLHIKVVNDKLQIDVATDIWWLISSIKRVNLSAYFPQEWYVCCNSTKRGWLYYTDSIYTKSSSHEGQGKKLEGQAI